MGAQPGSRGKQIRCVSHRDEEASSSSRVTPQTTAPSPDALLPPEPASARGRGCRGGAGAQEVTRRGGAAVAAGAAAAAAATAAAGAAAWQRGGRERRPRHPAPARRWGPAAPPGAFRAPGLPAGPGQEGRAGAALRPLRGHRGTGRRWPVLPERDPGGPSLPGSRGGQCGPGLEARRPTGSACRRRLLAPLLLALSPRWSRGRSGRLAPGSCRLAPRVRILPCAACCVHWTRLRWHSRSAAGVGSAHPPALHRPCVVPVTLSGAGGRIPLSLSQRPPELLRVLLNPSGRMGGTRVCWDGPVPAGNHSRKSGLTSPELLASCFGAWETLETSRCKWPVLFQLKQLVL